MELLNRYLHAVRFWLPGSKQDDILEELSEDIRSQIEEKEAALGRGMNDTELGTFLKQLGDPMIVAGRFLPDQHLIGPPWFPIYLFVLRLVLLWVLLPLAVIMAGGAVLFSTHNRATVLFDILGGFWTGALCAFAVITLVFATLDRYHHKLHPRVWDPLKLPAVPKPRDPRKIQRASSIVELIWGILFILWWADILRFPAIPGNTVRLGPGPAWQQAYLPVLLLSLSGVALSVANLVYPWWSRLQSVVRLGIDAAMVAIACMLLKGGGHWFEVNSSVLSMERLEELRRILDAGISITLTLVAVIGLFACIQDIRRLIPSKIPKRSAVRGV